MIINGVKRFLRSGWNKLQLKNSELRSLNSDLRNPKTGRGSGFFVTLLFFVALPLLSASCAHLSPGLEPENVSPFFHIQTDPAQQSRRIDAAGPFYSQYESPKEREWTLRPFFSYRLNQEEQTEELEYFYPFGRYKKTPEGTLKRLIPFYSSFKPAREPGREEPEKNENVDLFPVFWGKDKKGESYGGLFPLGGVFRDRFGRDEIGFVLWPFHTWVQEGENRTVHFFWPVFYLSGGGQRSGFRLWPLYGQEKQEGEGAYRKIFFMWPIGHYQQRNLDTENPKTYFYLFPFYLSEKSPHEAKTILLWPFFNFYREEQFNYFQVDLPWPIMQVARGENAEAVKLWPLIAYRRVDQREKVSIFWPFFAQEKEENEERDEVLNQFLYVSKIHQVYYKKEDRWERVTRLWPFFRYAEDGRGLVHFYFPAVMPADWEGLERHYGMLFRIFEYYQDGQGKEISKLLWGLVYHQKQPDLRRFEISLLFTYHQDKAAWKWSFLKGLIGYGRDGHQKQLRLFYIPISWKEEPEAGKSPGSPSGG
jgi:hypothetical protein